MPRLLVYDRNAGNGDSVRNILASNAEFEVSEYDDGAAAFDALKEGCVDLVLADLHRASLNDNEFLKRSRAEFPNVPIVLLTSNDDEDAAVKGLVLGAARFLPRNRMARGLIPTVQRVLELMKAVPGHAKLQECLTEVECRYLLRNNDRELISPLIDSLLARANDFGFCTLRERMHLALCLDEALVNAIVHGNLEVESKLRADDPDRYENLIERRMQEPPYRHRTVTARGTFTATESTFVIHDQGRGFDPGDIPNPTDDWNLEKPFGRGLFLIRTLMDDVSFNARGNEITMRKRNHSNGDREPDPDDRCF